MPPRKGLSRGEMEVARIVWELRHATVRQVLDALPADREIDFTTVQTYLRRLEEKGYLNVRLEGRTRIYSPKFAHRLSSARRLTTLWTFCSPAMPCRW